MPHRWRFNCVPFALLLLSNCQNPPRRDAAAQESSTFKKPSATEIFNLRSRCFALGDELLRGNKVIPPLAQEQTSHYDPKTNRCYVEVLVHKPISDPNKMKWTDYSFDGVYDGQTRELLAYVEDKEGKTTAFMKNGPPNPTGTETLLAIRALMNDDRRN